MLFYLLPPLIAYALMLVAASALARTSSPNPPRDGTGGPWCLPCRYSLAGIPGGSPCPECGRGRRFSFPTPSPHATAWVLLSLVASLLSHAPIAFAWLAHRRPAPSIYSSFAVEAFFVAAAMLILASRMRGRSLLWALLAMTIPQTIADSIDLTLMNSKMPDSPAVFVFFFYLPIVSALLMPVTFIVYAIVGVIRSRRARFRPAT